MGAEKRMIKQAKYAREIDYHLLHLTKRSLKENEKKSLV